MNRKNLIALSLFALVGSNAAFAQEGRDGYLREYGIDLQPAAVSSSTTRVAASGTQAPRVAVDAIAARDADYLRKYGIDLRRPAQSNVPGTVASR